MPDRTSSPPRLGVMVVAALTLPLIVMAFFAWLTWRDTWAAAERELARGADASAEYALRVLDAHRLAADLVNRLLQGLSDEDIRAREDELHRELRDLVPTLPGVLTIAVLSREAEVLLLANTFPVPRGLQVPDREWVVALREPDAPSLHVSAVTTGRSTGPVFFAVSRRRTHTGNAAPPGSLDGIISISVDPHALSAGLAVLGGPQGDVAGLIRPDGALLARGSGLPSPPWQIPAGSPLRDLARSGAIRGTFLGRSIGHADLRDDQSRLVAFRRLGELPLYATMTRSARAIAAQWHQVVLLQLAVGLPAWVALVAFALLLQRRQRDLAAVNASLEQRIDARTAELRDSEAATRNALTQLDVVYATAPVGLCVLDLQGRFLRINAELAEMNGLPVEAHIGRTIREVLPNIADAGEALLRQVLETGEPVLGMEIEGETPALPGARRTWVEDWSPIRDDRGTIVAVNVVTREVTEERAGAQALAASEARLRIAQQAARMGTWELDPEAGELIWSDEQYALFGMDRARDGPMNHRRFLDEVVYREDLERLRDVSAAAFASGEFDADFRAWRRRPDGTREVRWITGRGRRIPRPDGRPGRMFGVNLDITERKAAEERQALLMREVDHRAKNALAVVQAALRLTPKDDADAYARAIEGRVAALARAHTILAAGKWESAALRELVEAELAAFKPADIIGLDGAPSDVRLIMEGPDLALAPDAVQALSMALHELATNAAKYGALSTPEGRIHVTWRADTRTGRLTIIWREDGGPPVAGAPVRRGFGSRVIEATVKNQLGGSVERDWKEEGLVCVIAVPIARALVLGGARAA